MKVTRISLSNLQTQALVSLLHTVDATSSSIDIVPQDEPYGSIRIAVWRDSEPTSWQIELDGMTREV